jgi:DNA-binding transcriptional LysR family regulator
MNSRFSSGISSVAYAIESCAIYASPEAVLVGLKQAAIAGLGIVAVPGYVCRDEVRSGALRRVLPTWIAEDSTLIALMPFSKAFCRRSAPSSII